MTAIDAAIVELEAQRERIGILITELRRHARSIEDSHAPLQTLPAPAPVTLKIDGREVVRTAAKAPAKPAHRTSPPPTKPVPSPTGDTSSVVIAALTKAGRPMSKAEIVPATKLNAYQVKLALKALNASKRIVHTGSTHSSRWALAPSSPAKTSTPAFETVWNGTKDAQGEATLSGPRTRKAN